MCIIISVSSYKMFAMKCPISFTCAPTRRRISRTIRGYYSLNTKNSKPIEKVVDVGMFHILAFIQDGDTEIYTVNDQIIAFRTFEDAFRFKSLLEADINITPFVQFASRFELDHACNVGKYECLVVNEGALVTPSTLGSGRKKYEK